MSKDIDILVAEATAKMGLLPDDSLPQYRGIQAQEDHYQNKKQKHAISIFIPQREARFPGNGGETEPITEVRPRDTRPKHPPHTPGGQRHPRRPAPPT